MGTRADFYVGRGEGAEWIGSISYNGWPSSFIGTIGDAKTEEEYRNGVAAILADWHDIATLPEDGWPWPWETSETTDYAYSFDDGQALTTNSYAEWATLDVYVRSEEVWLSEDLKTRITDWPVMERNRRSTKGIMLLGV